jgi:hypothetical protein
MSLKATIAELILNATTAGRALLTAADAAAQKVLLSLSKSDVGLGNVDNTSDASKPVSAATEAALSGKQATLVSGTNLKTVNSTSLLGAGDITISAGIGGSTGATDNRLLRSDGTGGATLQASGITIDDSHNVTGVATLAATGQTFLASASSTGTYDFTRSGDSSPLLRLNQNGAATAARRVEVRGEGIIAQTEAGADRAAISQYGIRGSLNTLLTWTNNASSTAATIDVGIGREASGVLQINNGTAGTLRDLSCRNLTALSVVQVNEQLRGINGNLTFTDHSTASTWGLLRLGGTSSAYPAIKRNGAAVNLRLADDSADADVSARAITASGLMCAGTYTVATLPSAAAQSGKFIQVTDSTTRTIGDIPASGGSFRVMVFSDGATWRLFSGVIPSTVLAPAIPANLRQASCSDGMASIAWDAVSGATNYRVEWASSSGGSYSLVYSGASTSFSVELGGYGSPGRWFRVRAENASGNSDYSAAANFACNFW